MPAYDYKCDECGTTVSVVHSIKDTHDKCNTCGSAKIAKTVVPFLSNTETSQEAQHRHHEVQMVKDLERYQKDDKFAANVTGADDANSDKRKQEAMQSAAAKAKSKQETIKRPGWNFSK